MWSNRRVMLVDHIILLVLHWQFALLDSKPVFECDAFSGSTCLKYHNMGGEHISEAASVGMIVYTLAAYDDSDTNITRPTPISYDIIPTDPSNIGEGTTDGFLYFNVNPVTGQVIVKAEVDYETFAEIRPTWNISNEIEALTSYVRVYVDDANDNYPMFQGLPYHADDIPENTAIGYKVFEDVLATDNDTTNDFHTVTYHLVNYTQSKNYECEISAFSIDETMGTIVLMTAVPYKTYTICIEARDQGVPYLANYTTLEISVLDVQGDPPVFQATPYQMVVSEDEPSETEVIIVYAVDGDYGVPFPNAIEFHIVDGDENDDYTMTSIGQLIINKPLDIERKANYTLTIQATELDNSQRPEQITSFETISITLYDVNDNQPVFIPSSATIELQENSPEMTSLNLEILAIDVDVEDVNALFKLSLSAQTVFYLKETTVIGSTTVDVLVFDNSLLDSEMRDNVTFQLYATPDGHTDPTSVADITVIIQDVNDNPPIFATQRYACVVIDGDKLRNEIGHACQVEAFDADITEMNRDLNYTILNSTTTMDVFDIDPKSGNISMIGQLDQKHGGAEIQLELGVENTASPYLSDTTIILINVSVEPKEPMDIGLIIGLSAGLSVAFIIVIVILCIIVTKNKNSKHRHVAPSTVDLQDEAKSGCSNNMGSGTAWSAPEYETKSIHDTTEPQIDPQISEIGGNRAMNSTINRSDLSINTTVKTRNCNLCTKDGDECNHKTNTTNADTTHDEFDMKSKYIATSPTDDSEDHLNGGLVDTPQLNVANDENKYDDKYNPSKSLETSSVPKTTADHHLPPIFSSSTVMASDGLNLSLTAATVDLTSETAPTKHKKRSKRKNHKAKHEPSADEPLHEKERQALALSNPTYLSSD